MAANGPSYHQLGSSCQECGSRKAQPRQVIPSLRNLKSGAVGDRWALDVAGPLPEFSGKNKYVVAAVEYVASYAVAPAANHTAIDFAKFITKHIVFRFVLFRELLIDYAPGIASDALDVLVVLLQVVADESSSVSTPNDWLSRAISSHLERLCESFYGCNTGRLGSVDRLQSVCLQFSGSCDCYAVTKSTDAWSHPADTERTAAHWSCGNNACLSRLLCLADSNGSCQSENRSGS